MAGKRSGAQPSRPCRRGQSKPAPRVGLAAWGDVLVARHMGNGVAQCQVLARLRQGCVLCRLEVQAFQAFELNAHRVVVALRAASVAGAPGVPGALVAIDKLPQCAFTGDEEMGRYLQAPDALEVGCASQSGGP